MLSSSSKTQKKNTSLHLKTLDTEGHECYKIKGKSMLVCPRVISFYENSELNFLPHILNCVH